MSIRVIGMALTVFVATLIAVFPRPAWASDSGWLSPHGVVDARSGDGSAEVGVQIPNQLGQVGNAAESITGHPYYAEMTEQSAIPDLCRYINAGLAGIDDRQVLVCFAPAEAPVEDAAGGSGVSPAVLAARAVARLTVPDPRIVLSPDPSDNKWNVLAVGLPIWVSSPDPGAVSTTVSEQGIDISLSASRGSVRFDWGDGATSVCQVMRPRPVGVDPLTPSPDCGHTYLWRGDYTIGATAGWAVSWQALGQSGTLPLTSVSSVQVPIREFESVVVG